MHEVKPCCCSISVDVRSSFSPENIDQTTAEEVRGWGELKYLPEHLNTEIQGKSQHRIDRLFRFKPTKINFKAFFTTIINNICSKNVTGIPVEIPCHFMSQIDGRLVKIDKKFHDYSMTFIQVFFVFHAQT